MTAIMLFAIYAWIIVSDLPVLIRHKKWKTLCVSGVFFTMGLVMSILFLLEHPLPSPMMILNDLFKSIGLSY